MTVFGFAFDFFGVSGDPARPLLVFPEMEVGGVDFAGSLDLVRVHSRVVREWEIMAGGGVLEGGRDVVIRLSD